MKPLAKHHAKGAEETTDSLMKRCPAAGQEHSADQGRQSVAMPRRQAPVDAEPHAIDRPTAMLDLLSTVLTQGFES